MRVAALYDIHGNLPALEAVLAELEADLVVVGGDVAPGAMVGEVLDRLQALEMPVRWVMGNGDREVLDPDQLASFEKTVELEVDELGRVLFCHGSPRSDTEIITKITPPERLAPMLEGVTADLVVCGHTHHQFELALGDRRIVNAGSVGLPYQGEAAAFWLLLGPGIDMRRTRYDTVAALEQMRAAGVGDLEESLKASLVEPVTADWIAEYFEKQATSARDA